MLKYLTFFFRYAFFVVIVRFIVLIVLGLNVRRKENLPKTGPAIIVGNHNSHLDTFVLMTLLPINTLGRIHPVAAADYFLKNKRLAWFAKNIVGIIPIVRGRTEKNIDPLEPCYEALDEGKILIVFPEGTRGKPEEMSDFKKGISFLSERYPNVPVTPVFMHGLGKALPKGETLFVPFFCDVFIGDALSWTGGRDIFMRTLNERMEKLAKEGSAPEWE